MIRARLYLECEDDDVGAKEGLQFIYKDVEFDAIPRVAEDISLNYYGDFTVTRVDHTPAYLNEDGRPGTGVTCSATLEQINTFLGNEEGWNPSG